MSGARKYAIGTRNQKKEANEALRKPEPMSRVSNCG
jgi:hypothetical protein